jgi:chromodomain-helicase-DNA-binding protein 7
MQIDRIIDERASYPDPFTRESTHWVLIKWMSLPYEACTWESIEILRGIEENAKKIDQDDAEALDEADEYEVDRQLELFHERQKAPVDRFPNAAPARPNNYRPMANRWQKLEESPEFKNNNALREYQLEGVNWLLYCWFHGRGSLVADEMGLGKCVCFVV